MTKKSLKEYLLESKQNYEFKIKIAGDVESGASAKIKTALARFDVDSLSDAKTTPIQESQVDFPDHSNIGVTLYDVSVKYPVTSHQVRDLVAEALKITHSCVKVRNLKEQEEEEINNQYCPNHPSGEALLTKDYEKSDHQSLVGDKQVMSLLKELSKTKKTGTQYKGVNDQLLAKSVPSEKSVSSTGKVENSISPIGSKKTVLPDPYKGK